MAGLLVQPEIEWLYRTPEWIITLLFLGAMVAACTIGYYLGTRFRAKKDANAEAGGLLPTIAAALIGVLGLLLGFTMSMSVSRYEERRLLVLYEANAIETAYLRAQGLPSPDNTELQDLLRQYAAARLHVSQDGLDIEKLQQGREEGARLQGRLWSRTAALARADPHSLPVAKLMDSLSNVSDLENSRWIIFAARVPAGVIYVDALLGLVAALLVGYDFGWAANRHLLSEALLILSIAMVMVVIIELDRPDSGVIRVSQQPLIDLQQRLAQPPY